MIASSRSGDSCYHPPYMWKSRTTDTRHWRKLCS
uniref:Uncharacterized protein n=1 Tax=Arundo donax TaxID=35708 RepID=A0A0A9GG06_ARUDO